VATRLIYSEPDQFIARLQALPPQVPKAPETRRGYIIKPFTRRAAPTGRYCNSVNCGGDAQEIEIGTTKTTFPFPKERPGLSPDTENTLQLSGCAAS
jgi:hypothetical protein